MHLLGRATPEPELLCIYGTGDLGRSLGMRLLQSGYRVVYGSRQANSCGPVPPGVEVPLSLTVLAEEAFNLLFCFHFLTLCASVFACVQVMGHAEAAKIASLIFLCVHREHYGFLAGLAPILQGKVSVLLSVIYFGPFN